MHDAVTADAPTDSGRYRRLMPWAVASSVLFLVAILAWYAVRRDVDLESAVRALDLRVLPLALALHVAAHLFWAARFAIIAREAGLDVGALRAWGTITSGVFGGAVTPGRIGGEGLKLALLLRRGARPGPAGRLLIADRATDLVFFMLMGIVAAILLPPLFGAQGAAARTFAVAGTGMLALFLTLLTAFLMAPQATGRRLEAGIGWCARRIGRDGPAIQGHVHDLLVQARTGMVDVLGRKPWLTAAALLLTLANWIVEYGAIWILLQGLGHDVPFWAVFFVGVVLTLVANIPITPGGSGVAEVAALSLLTPLAPGLSPLFVVAWRGVTYYYDLLVGGVTTSILLPRKRLHDKA